MKNLADLPFDPSPLGMPRGWYWFEAALDCAIRWNYARDLHATHADQIVQSVASDACFFLASAADQAWSAFWRHT